MCIITSNATIYKPESFQDSQISFIPIIQKQPQQRNFAQENNLNQNSKVSLSGNYLIQVPGLPIISGNADENRIGFRGCNTNSFSYEAYQNGSFRVTSPVISTRMFCENDQDSTYYQAFSSADTFQRSGSTITFLSSGQVSATLSP